MKRDRCREFYDLRLLLLLYGATNHWSGWVDGLARCITPVVADILSKDLDFRRKSLPIPYARYDDILCRNISDFTFFSLKDLSQPTEHTCGRIGKLCGASTGLHIVPGSPRPAEGSLPSVLGVP